MGSRYVEKLSSFPSIHGVTDGPDALPSTVSQASLVNLIFIKEIEMQMVLSLG